MAVVWAMACMAAWSLDMALGMAPGMASDRSGKALGTAVGTMSGAPSALVRQALEQPTGLACAPA